MFIIILFLLLGVLSGWGCRKCEARCHVALSSFVGRWQGRLLTGLIWLLLFLLGIEVGSNRMIVRSLPTLGGRGFAAVGGWHFGLLPIGLGVMEDSQEGRRQICEYEVGKRF